MGLKKTLYILRHAKAAPGQDDHARPLAERGVVESKRMGAYLAAQHIAPERVLCSTSLRTKQTFEYMQIVYPKIVEAEYTEKLYLPSANEMIQLIKAIPDAVSSLMLVGHNPGLHELCLKLIGSGDEKMRRELVAQFPPCALAEITWEGQWRDATSLKGALQRFVIPDTAKG